MSWRFVSCFYDELIYIQTHCPRHGIVARTSAIRLRYGPSSRADDISRFMHTESPRTDDLARTDKNSLYTSTCFRNAI